MSIMDWAAWCVIIGISCVAIGGLMLWAYGDSMRLWLDRKGADDEATLAGRRQFTGVLIYSMVLIVVGLAFLAQGTLFLLRE